RASAAGSKEEKAAARKRPRATLPAPQNACSDRTLRPGHFRRSNDVLSRTASCDLFIGYVAHAAVAAGAAAVGVDEAVVGPRGRHRQQAPVDGGGFVAQREQRFLVAVRSGADLGAQVLAEI